MSRTKKILIETLVMLLAVALMLGGYLWFEDHEAHKYDNVQKEEYQRYPTIEGSKEVTFSATLGDNMNIYDQWTYPRYKDLMKNAKSSYVICNGTWAKGVSRSELESYLQIESKKCCDQSCEPFQNGYTLKHIETWTRDTLKHMTGTPNKGHIEPPHDRSNGNDIKTTFQAFRKTLSARDLKNAYMQSSKKDIRSCLQFADLKISVKNPRIQKIAVISGGVVCMEIDATVKTVNKSSNAKDSWIPEEGESKEVTFILVEYAFVKDVILYDIAVKGYN